jgi:hypothetical protein
MRELFEQFVERLHARDERLLVGRRSRFRNC